MTIEPKFDPDTEWLQLAPPVGLVVSSLALSEAKLVPTRQTPVDTNSVRPHIEDEDLDKPALRDPWAFLSQILGWRPQDVAGAPGGPSLPDLTVRADDGTPLEPTWALRAAKGEEALYQLLVRLEASGINPDAKHQLEGWEATPQQRFERLLRETKVHAGLLLTDLEIRLVYAPQGRRLAGSRSRSGRLAPWRAPPFLGG